MRKAFLSLSVLMFVGVVGASQAQAHCQIPCGIYDDHNRIHIMLEDVKTIAKAVRQIKALSGKNDATSKNQLVRWVLNKEKHASRIIRIISEYFLTQKIKPASAKNKKKYQAYLVKLARHHAVMKAAMKTKQTVSGKAVAALRNAINAIAAYWPKKK